MHPEVLSVLREIPRGEPMSTVFFSVPTLGTFKKDCKRAGIVLRDEAGRTVDFHCFRMTLATWLQREGIQPSLVQKIMRHASFDTTEKYDTDLRIHDLEQAVSQLRLPRAAVASEGQVATGTHGRASEECHQNCHHSVHETVRSGASGCESGVKEVSLSAHEKAPPGSGRADSSKRVRRFERPTFTLATCKHTDLTAATESISCGDGKGVTNTATTGVQDDRQICLLEAWPALPVGVKDAIVVLVEGK